MKFPRRLRLFDGQPGLLPVAGVFLLLLLCLVFHTSLVHSPGLPVPLPAFARTNRLVIESATRFHYDGQWLDESNLAARLRADASARPPVELLSIQPAPAVSNAIVARVIALARELHFPVDVPGARLELPEYGPMPGVTGRVAIVVVNLAGEIYYDHRVTTPVELRAHLAVAVAHAPADPLTVLLLADKTVSYDTILHLGHIARLAGCRGLSLGTRPPLWRKPSPGADKP